MQDIAIIMIIGFVLISLCYIIINQMLMVNAINKRLMYMAESALALLDKPLKLSDLPDINTKEEEFEYSFDPHNQEV